MLFFFRCFKLTNANLCFRLREMNVPNEFGLLDKSQTYNIALFLRHQLIRVEVDGYPVLLRHLSSRYQRYICVPVHQENGFYFNPGLEHFLGSKNAEYSERIIRGRINLFSEKTEFRTLLIQLTRFFNRKLTLVPVSYNALFFFVRQDQPLLRVQKLLPLEIC